MFTLIHRSQSAAQSSGRLSGRRCRFFGFVSVVLLAQMAIGQEAAFQGLGDLAGGGFKSAAQAVSADGRTVVGYGTSDLGREAFRWTAAVGLEGLGDFDGGKFESLAYDVSADGSVVVERTPVKVGGQVIDYAVQGQQFDVYEERDGFYRVNISSKDGWLWMKHAKVVQP